MSVTEVWLSNVYIGRFLFGGLLNKGSVGVVSFFCSLGSCGLPAMSFLVLLYLGKSLRPFLPLEGLPRTSFTFWLVLALLPLTPNLAEKVRAVLQEKCVVIHFFILPSKDGLNVPLKKPLRLTFSFSFPDFSSHFPPGILCPVFPLSTQSLSKLQCSDYSRE